MLTKKFISRYTFWKRIDEIFKKNISKEQNNISISSCSFYLLIRNDLRFSHYVDKHLWGIGKIYITSILKYMKKHFWK